MKHFSTSFSHRTWFMFMTVGLERIEHVFVKALLILLLAGSWGLPIFARSGNAYVDLALPATAMTESGFQANWAEPPGVSIDRFILDISTSSTFATFVSGYQEKDVINFSIEVTGLQSETTYYYRIRYVETGTTTPSAYSNVVSVKTLKSNFLSSLTFHDTDLEVLPIEPVFNKNVTSYTMDTDVSALTITPVAQDGYSTISCKINNGSETVISNVITTVSFNLNQGQNTIELKVSSPDLAFKIYYIQVRVIVPTIVISVNPLKAAPGSSVTITGSRFSDTSSQNVVFFGTARGTVTEASSTSLTVMVPNGASNAPVTVLNKETASMGYSATFFFPTAITHKSTFVLSDFNAKFEVPIPTQTFQRADIMDVNNDTKPDIIWTKDSDNTNIKLNNSSFGGLAFPTDPKNFSQSSQARVKAGDINGDGRPDIITTTDRSFLFNTTTTSNFDNLTFETYDSGKNDQLSAELMHDIDGDGKPDFITAGGSVRRNMTVGNVAVFGTPVPLNANATVHAIGDFDGDGKPDVVVVNSPKVGIMRNTSKIGRISFEPRMDMNVDIFSVALGDLDGDGKLDMVSISYSGKVTTFRNTTTGSAISFDIKEQFTTETTPGALAVGDIDGDGKPDLAITLAANSADGYKVSAILNTTDASGIKFGSSVVMYSAPSPGTQVYITDMDRNGRPDLSVVNFYEHTVSIFSYKPPLSNEARLSALTISSGELYSAYNLTNAFSQNYRDTVYNVLLDAVTTSFNVTATGYEEAQALMIRINGGEYASITSGLPAALSLLPGANKIEVSILAADGVTILTYTINVYNPFAPPGKALKFRGTNEYVEVRNSTDSPSFTLETWIKTETTSPTGTFAYEGAALFSADQAGNANDFIMTVLNNKIAFHDGNASVTTIGKTVVTDGRWHHVALVREEGVAVRIYIDGILDATGVAGTGQLKAVAVMTLGGVPGYLPASYTGSMDEVRVWKSARTGADIAQNYLTRIDLTTESLQAYYNLDIGAQETSPVMINMKGVLYEKGYFTNLDPLGSNWVESYAMVVPTAKNASNSTSTGFTANWSAPSISSATRYFLDVATSPTFAPEFMVSGFDNLEVLGTAKIVTIPDMPSGRQMAVATYYYRVRSEKSAEIGQGANSATITVSYDPLPVNLISFTGKRIENTNLLEWRVTNETEFDRYEIERSSNAKTFERIGTVTARSNEVSGITNYDYADAIPEKTYSPAMYYRLKMIDKDGSDAYSRLLGISRDVAVKPSVYPNPVLEVVTVRVDAALLNTTAGVYDSGGRLMQTIAITKNDQQVNLKNLVSGLYLIKFENGSVQRIVKE